jgi:chromosome partitioning protein
MRRVIVLNTKGGSGKTTVATNLAAAYAKRGWRTALIDYDPQASATHWLRARSKPLPDIHGAHLHEASRAPLSGAWQLRVPRDTERVVADTPAGVHAGDLAGRIGPDDTVLMPVLPSAIDIRAATDFIRDLLLLAKLRVQDRRLAIIANRARRNTNSYRALQRFLETLHIPVAAELRDTQHYLTAADTGVGICELGLPSSARDASTWNKLVDWIEQGATPARPLQQAVPAAAPVDNRPKVPSFLMCEPATAATN